MIRPYHMPPDAYVDDPVDKIEPPASDQDSPFALASHGITRIKEWTSHRTVKQRGLRHDLVTLCICPELLPCKQPSAAWVGQQHGVSREYAARLGREFVRKFGDYIQFRGQRFLCQALAIKK